MSRAASRARACPARQPVRSTRRRAASRAANLAGAHGHAVGLCRRARECRRGGLRVRASRRHLPLDGREGHRFRRHVGREPGMEHGGPPHFIERRRERRAAADCRIQPLERHEGGAVLVDVPLARLDAEVAERSRCAGAGQRPPPIADSGSSRNAAADSSRSRARSWRVGIEEKQGDASGADLPDADLHGAAGSATSKRQTRPSASGPDQPARRTSRDVRRPPAASRRRTGAGARSRADASGRRRRAARRDRSPPCRSPPPPSPRRRCREAAPDAGRRPARVHRSGRSCSPRRDHHAPVPARTWSSAAIAAS